MLQPGLCACRKLLQMGHDKCAAQVWTKTVMLGRHSRSRCCHIVSQDVGKRSRQLQQQDNSQAAATAATSASGLTDMRFLSMPTLPKLDSQAQSQPLSHGTAFSNLLQSARQYQVLAFAIYNSLCLH